MSDNYRQPSAEIYNNLIQRVLSSVGNFNVPKDFHTRAKIAIDMVNFDSTGLITSLTDFQVSASTVDLFVNSFNMETNKILDKYFEILNIDWSNKGVPMGIKALSRQCYRELYQGGSFPIMKYTGVMEINGYKFPKNLYFLNGASVKSETKNTNKKNGLFDFNYTIDDKPIGDNVIMSKPYARWGDEFPTPYLIRRGVYKSYEIIDSIKNKQKNLLDKIIPLMMLIKRGSDKIVESGEGMTDEEVENLQKDYKEIIDHRNSLKVASRATMYDEEFEQIIPDIGKFFKQDLVYGAEKTILTALGFIDVADSVSSSRKESILNPKAFISQTDEGIEMFKNDFLKPLMYIIKKMNSKSHPKMFSKGFDILNKKPQIFIGDEMRKILRSCYDRGILSKETYADTVANVNYKTEKFLRIKEAMKGDELVMKPQVVQNQEGTTEPTKANLIFNQEKRTDDEKSVENKEGPEKIEYENAMLQNVTVKKNDTSINVKKMLDKNLKNIFNESYNTSLEMYSLLYNNEEAKCLASKEAWKIVDERSIMNKKGLVENV